MTSRPLEGIRVVDLTTFLSGPFGTQILGDLGADVIKVEPFSGDSSRAIPPHFVGEESAYFLGNNRNKRSIAVDLKTPDGLEVVLRLIASADVVIENFRPGICKRLGLDPEELRKERPELVWASISGFGQTGELKDQPAYDMIVQAMSGVMSLTGEPDGSPVRLGIPAGDLVAGMYAALGILASLVERRRSGEGATIDISMLDGQLAMVSYQAVYAMLSGIAPKPQGSGHDSIPTYRSFLAGDGRKLVVTANTHRMWEGLCAALGLGGLPADARFLNGSQRLKNKDALWAELEPVFLTRGAADWVSEFRRRGVPAALINNVPEALEEARRYGRNMVVTLDDHDGHRVDVLGNPIKFVREPEDPRDGEWTYPPRLGEHTESIMQSLGFDRSHIDAMVASGAVKSLVAVPIVEPGRRP